MLEITYKNTVDQLVECSNFIWSESKGEKGLDKPRIFLTATLAVLAIFALINEEIIMSVMLVVMGIFFYFVYPTILKALMKRVFRRAANKKDAIPNEVNIILDDHTFKVKIEGKVREIKVNDIKSVNEVANCYFIKFNDREEISLIIPFNAFKDNEEELEFKKYIMK